MSAPKWVIWAYLGPIYYSSMGLRGSVSLAWYTRATELFVGLSVTFFYKISFGVEV